MKMSPSAPTERCRVHTLATNAGIFLGSITRVRLSTTMKSLPAPDNFMNGIFFGAFFIATYSLPTPPPSRGRLWLGGSDGKLLKKRGYGLSLYQAVFLFP